MNKILLSFLLCLATSFVLADAPERERLIELLDNADNLTADFTQKTYKETSANVDVTSGTMSISKPLRFNWTVKKPYEQQVISDGETLWVFDPDLEQATYQPLSENVQQSPAMILVQPREALTGQYDIIEVKTDDLTAYKLYPISEETNFKELMLLFSDRMISEIRILDSLNQETIITFANVKTGQAISSEQFEFVPPPGTDLFPQM